MSGLALISVASPTLAAKPKKAQPVDTTPVVAPDALKIAPGLRKYAADWVLSAKARPAAPPKKAH